MRNVIIWHWLGAGGSNQFTASEKFAPHPVLPPPPPPTIIQNLRTPMQNLPTPMLAQEFTEEILKNIDGQQNLSDLEQRSKNDFHL